MTLKELDSMRDILQKDIGVSTDKYTFEISWEKYFAIRHWIIHLLFGWMMNFYGPCVGWTLFKFGRRKIELWWCPKDYTIPQHSHPDEDIELLFVTGHAIFSRVKNSELQSRAVAGWLPSFKTFSIPAGTVHWFSVSDSPLVFINFSKWKKGVKVTSASKDFQLS